EGDVVFSRDQTSGEQRLDTVSSTFVRQHAPIVEIEVTDDGGASETLAVTAEHPFWAKSRGWVQVSSLGVGDELHTRDGRPEIVTAIRYTPRKATVYNIEVAAAHTYFVGRLGTWVHNKPMRNPRTPLPTLDQTGKVHGKLPLPHEIENYTVDELMHLQAD